ncbi:hypothetical protein [Candidatus Methanoprimaticola sp. MG2]|uniref:hypothetical protein n=1 Tax=Candidatus Methanoprimaticola sp. MG2 TaxID=3228838 RepID=UPI0039C637DB
MTDECKILDPTAFGLFFVALISLPIALVCFDTYFDLGLSQVADNLSGLLIIASFFIFVAAIAAYKANSNFGFIVFGLVAIGVFCAGAGYAGTIIGITLALIYVIALIWSYHAGTPKLLTLILLTTALIFLFGSFDGEIFVLLKALAALANFALTLYLAFALADEHLPCF